MDSKDENKKSRNTDELRETYENLRRRQAELEEMILYLQNENQTLKQKYQEYRKRLNTLNEYLEKNAKIYHELFTDTRCSLQMGRNAIMNSPLLQKESSLAQVNNSQDRSPNDSPLGSSTPFFTRKKSQFQPQTCNDKIAAVACISSGSDNVRVKKIAHRKIDIEPINITAIQEACVAVAQEPPQPLGDTSMRESLSVILEEPSNVSTETNANQSGSSINTESNSVQSVGDNTKKAFVKLERLPSQIMEYHVQKINNSGSSGHRSFNDTDSFSDQSEDDYSTNLDQNKAMNLLGLIPTTQVRDKPNIYTFVNTRRKYNTLKSEPISPKKERFSKWLHSKSLRGETISPRQVPSISPKMERTSSISNSVTLRKILSNSPKKERTSAIRHPDTQSEKSLSPKEQNPKLRSTKRTGSTPVEPQLTNKKRKESLTEVTNSRPVRKAKPTQLKENSLKGKLRRN